MLLVRWRSVEQSLPNLFQEEHAMKKRWSIVIALVLVLLITWVAFGQAGGGGQQRFAQQREAQMKAAASLQENAAKLRAMMDASAKAMQGRSFQDMTEEDRTKMREQRQEQQKLVAAMEQDLARLKGVRQMLTEEDQTVAPLKDILASAQKENAKETAAKVEKLMADRQKAFEDKVKAMGYDPSMLEQMRQRSRQ
jgi:ABC-type multidrug transport system fused ATPase/permease subunit